ncbi:MAG: transglutaminase domain-containing protein [Candidatus Altiarchaeia archaeon]
MDKPPCGLDNGKKGAAKRPKVAGAIEDIILGSASRTARLFPGISLRIAGTEFFKKLFAKEPFEDGHRSGPGAYENSASKRDINHDEKFLLTLSRFQDCCMRDQSMNKLLSEEGCDPKNLIDPSSYKTYRAEHALASRLMEWLSTDENGMERMGLVYDVEAFSSYETLETGRASCWSLSSLYKELCDAIGIPAGYLVSFNHVSNRLTLDGKEYYVNVTSQQMVPLDDAEKSGYAKLHKVPDDYVEYAVDLRRYRRDRDLQKGSECLAGIPKEYLEDLPENLLLRYAAANFYILQAENEPAGKKAAELFVKGMRHYQSIVEYYEDTGTVKAKRDAAAGSLERYTEAPDIWICEGDNACKRGWLEEAIEKYDNAIAASRVLGLTEKEEKAKKRKAELLINHAPAGRTTADTSNVAVHLDDAPSYRQTYMRITPEKLLESVRAGEKEVDSIVSLAKNRREEIFTAIDKIRGDKEFTIFLETDEGKAVEKSWSLEIENRMGRACIDAYLADEVPDESKIEQAAAFLYAAKNIDSSDTETLKNEAILELLLGMPQSVEEKAYSAKRLKAAANELMGLKRYSDAGSYLKKYLELYPTSKTAKFELLMCEKHLGKKTKNIFSEKKKKGKKIIADEGNKRITIKAGSSVQAFRIPGAGVVSRVIDENARFLKSLKSDNVSQVIERNDSIFLFSKDISREHAGYNRLSGYMLSQGVDLCCYAQASEGEGLDGRRITLVENMRAPRHIIYKKDGKWKTVTLEYSSRAESWKIEESDARESDLENAQEEYDLAGRDEYGGLSLVPTKGYENRTRKKFKPNMLVHSQTPRRKKIPDMSFFLEKRIEHYCLIKQGTYSDPALKYYMHSSKALTGKTIDEHAHERRRAGKTEKIKETAVNAILAASEYAGGNTPEQIARSITDGILKEIGDDPVRRAAVKPLLGILEAHYKKIVKAEKAAERIALAEKYVWAAKKILWLLSVGVKTGPVQGYLNSVALCHPGSFAEYKEDNTLSDRFHEAYALEKKKKTRMLTEKGEINELIKNLKTEKKAIVANEGYRNRGITGKINPKDLNRDTGPLKGTDYLEKMFPRGLQARADALFEQKKSIISKGKTIAAQTVDVSSEAKGWIEELSATALSLYDADLPDEAARVTGILAEAYDTEIVRRCKPSYLINVSKLYCAAYERAAFSYDERTGVFYVAEAIKLREALDHYVFPEDVRTKHMNPKVWDSIRMPLTKLAERLEDTGLNPSYIKSIAQEARPYDITEDKSIENEYFPLNVLKSSKGVILPLEASEKIVSWSQENKIELQRDADGKTVAIRMKDLRRYEREHPETWDLILMPNGQFERIPPRIKLSKEEVAQHNVRLNLPFNKDLLKESLNKLEPSIKPPADNKQADAVAVLLNAVYSNKDMWKGGEVKSEDASYTLEILYNKTGPPVFPKGVNNKTQKHRYFLEHVLKPLIKAGVVAYKDKRYYIPGAKEKEIVERAVEIKKERRDNILPDAGISRNGPVYTSRLKTSELESTNDGLPIISSRHLKAYRECFGDISALSRMDSLIPRAMVYSIALLEDGSFTTTEMTGLIGLSKNTSISPHLAILKRNGYLTFSSGKYSKTQKFTVLSDKFLHKIGQVHVSATQKGRNKNMPDARDRGITIRLPDERAGRAESLFESYDPGKIDEAEELVLSLTSSLSEPASFIAAANLYRSLIYLSDDWFGPRSDYYASVACSLSDALFTRAEELSSDKEASQKDRIRIVAKLSDLSKEAADKGISEAAETLNEIMETLAVSLEPRQRKPLDTAEKYLEKERRPVPALDTSVKIKLFLDYQNTRKQALEKLTGKLEEACGEKLNQEPALCFMEMIAGSGSMEILKEKTGLGERAINAALKPLLAGGLIVNRGGYLATPSGIRFTETALFGTGPETVPLRMHADGIILPVQYEGAYQDVFSDVSDLLKLGGALGKNLVFCLATDPADRFDLGYAVKLLGRGKNRASVSHILVNLSKGGYIRITGETHKTYEKTEKFKALAEKFRSKTTGLDETNAGNGKKTGFSGNLEDIKFSQDDLRLEDLGVKDKFDSDYAVFKRFCSDNGVDIMSFNESQVESIWSGNLESLSAGLSEQITKFQKSCADYGLDVNTLDSGAKADLLKLALILVWVDQNAKWPAAFSYDKYIFCIKDFVVGHKGNCMAFALYLAGLAERAGLNLGFYSSSAHTFNRIKLGNQDYLVNATALYKKLIHGGKLSGELIYNDVAPVNMDMVIRHLLLLYYGREYKFDKATKEVKALLEKYPGKDSLAYICALIDDFYAHYGMDPVAKKLRENIPKLLHYGIEETGSGLGGTYLKKIIALTDSVEFPKLPGNPSTGKKSPSISRLVSEEEMPFYASGEDDSRRRVSGIIVQASSRRVERLYENGVYASLDRWFSWNPPLLAAAQEEIFAREDIPYVMLHVFDYVHMQSPGTVKALFAHMDDIDKAPAGKGSGRIAAFQSALYVFANICRNGAVPLNEVDGLLRKMFEAGSPGDYLNWVKDVLVPVLEAFLRSRSYPVPGTWSGVLIHCLAAFPGENAYSVSRESEIETIYSILRRLGADEAPSDAKTAPGFLLGLCYAATLKTEPAEVLEKIPAGMHLKHSFTYSPNKEKDISPWSGAEYVEGAGQCCGNIFGLPAELSHYSGEVLNPYYISPEAENELTDSIGFSIISRSPLVNRYNPSWEYVPSIYEYGESLLREAKEDTSVRKRLCDVMKIDETGIISEDLSSKLSPSGVYNIGFVMCRDEESVSLLGAETLKKKEKAELCQEYFGRAEMDNIAGAKQSSSRGLFLLSSQELAPYDDLVDYDGHLLTERLALDYSIQIMVSAKAAGATPDILEYVSQQAKKKLLERTRLLRYGKTLFSLDLGLGVREDSILDVSEKGFTDMGLACPKSLTMIGETPKMMVYAAGYHDASGGGKYVICMPKTGEKLLVFDGNVNWQDAVDEIKKIDKDCMMRIIDRLKESGKIKQGMPSERTLSVEEVDHMLNGFPSIEETEEFNKKLLGSDNQSAERIASASELSRNGIAITDENVLLPAEEISYRASILKKYGVVPDAENILWEYVRKGLDVERKGGEHDYSFRQENLEYLQADFADNQNNGIDWAVKAGRADVIRLAQFIQYLEPRQREYVVMQSARALKNGGVIVFAGEDSEVYKKVEIDGRRYIVALGNLDEKGNLVTGKYKQGLFQDLGFSGTMCLRVSENGLMPVSVSSEILNQAETIIREPSVIGKENVFNLKDNASINSFTASAGKSLVTVTDSVLGMKDIPERKISLAMGEGSCFDRPESGDTVIYVNEVKLDQAKAALEKMKQMGYSMDGVTPALMKEMLELDMYAHENVHGRLRALSNSQAVPIDHKFLTWRDANSEEPIIVPAGELKDYSLEQLKRNDLSYEQRVFFENLPKYQILTGVDTLSEGLAFYGSVKVLAGYASEQLKRNDLSYEQQVFFENLPYVAECFDILRSALSLEHSAQYQNETEDVKKELDSGLSLAQIVVNRLKDPDDPVVRTRITADDLVPVVTVEEFDETGNSLIDGLTSWEERRKDFPEGALSKMLTTIAYGRDVVSADAGYVSRFIIQNPDGSYDLRTGADCFLIELCKAYSCEDELMELMFQKVPKARSGLEE